MGSRTEYQINDSELVMYVRENNEDAKEELFKRYLPLLYKEIGRFRKRAQKFGIEEADLSQEAMLAFSHAINNYSDEEDVKFITFATLCIRRRLANVIGKYDTDKSKVLKTTIPLDAPIDEENNTLLDQVEDFHLTDPLKKMINTESLKEAVKRIDELSGNELQALSYDLDGLSTSEIAELMGMNSKQIYNLIHRARNKVKP